MENSTALVLSDPLSAPIETPPSMEIERPLPLPRHKSKWQPAKWTAKYNLVCQLHAAGQSENEIAAAIGLSRQQINNITNSEQGKIVVQEEISKIKDDFDRRVRGKVVRICDTALDRAEAYLKSDDQAKAFPLEMFDSAVKFLDRTYMLRQREMTPEVQVETNTLNIQNAVMIPKEQIQGLIQGLEKADKVRLSALSAPTESK